jgi:hypothetical protein
VIVRRLSLSAVKNAIEWRSCCPQKKESTVSPHCMQRRLRRERFFCQTLSVRCFRNSRNDRPRAAADRSSVLLQKMGTIGTALCSAGMVNQVKLAVEIALDAIRNRGRLAD